MPLVFGGAPVINVLVTMLIHPLKSMPSPLLFVGFLLVVLGASMALYFSRHRNSILRQKYWPNSRRE